MAIELYLSKGSKRGTKVDVYLDFLCPYCGKFEANYGSYIKLLMDHGYADVTYHPLAWIDQYSNGHHYSVRAARASEIIQNHQSDILFAYIEALLKKGTQPKEAKGYDVAQGSNTHLATVAKNVGAKEATIREIEQIPTDDEITQHMLKEAEKIGQEQIINGTPSVLVNGIYLPLAGIISLGTIKEIFPHLDDTSARVLAVISQIEKGEVLSYGEVGRIAGFENAGRMVGKICALNPLPLFIPCHRVVLSKYTKTGNLKDAGGYSMGGKEQKIKLLSSELSE